MLYFLTTFDSPRLDYTLNLVFGRILGLQYMRLSLDDYEPSRHPLTINYTQMMLPHAFAVPNVGLLQRADIEDVPLRMQEGGLPYLFYYTASGSSYHLPYDLFSAVFYLATDYEKYVAAHYDRHGRYEATAYPSRDWQLDHRPLVHHYCEQLWGLLEQHFGTAALGPRQQRTFETCFTFDIDFPWKYRYKGLKVAAGGLAKDLAKGAWQRVKERLRTHIRGQDPNDTFGLIRQHFGPERTRIFFLIDRTSEQDSRFTYRHPQYAQLIQSLVAGGYGVGLHPSYGSFLSRNVLSHEQWAFSQLIGGPVERSRQHFLRYRLPETYRYLLNNGIREEYSACLFQTGGFPCGMAIAWPWYDLLANQATELMLHPTHIMDRTLQQYLGLGPDAADERYQGLREACREVNGSFTVLLHNDVLSESEEWQGWREMVLKWAQA